MDLRHAVGFSRAGQTAEKIPGDSRRATIVEHMAREDLLRKGHTK